MNKFERYNASQIVPQETLLKKFNALIKYLNENPNVNIYRINTDYISGTLVYNISDIELPTIDGVKATVEIGDWLNFNGAMQAIVESVGETTVTVSLAYSIKGDDGETGNGIKDIVLVSKVGKISTYKIEFTNGSNFEYDITDGENGADGNGIKEIKKTGEEGLEVFYTIYFTNGSDFTYSIVNGRNGTNGVDGDDGNGILSVTLYATVGLAKTYRMTFTDGSHFDYVVRDGATGGGVGINTLLGVDFTATSISQVASGFDVTGTAVFTYTDDTGSTQFTHTATYSFILPVKAGSGVVVDISEDGKSIEIRLESSIQEDINLNTENIEKNTTDINTLKSDFALAKSAITKNTNDIVTANDNITKNTNDITTANNNISNLAGAGRTDETVKQNADSIETMKGNGWNGETIVTRQVKKVLFIDTVVNTSQWATDSTYTDFGYRATIPLTDVTADDFADIVLGVAEAVSGTYAPIVDTYAGGVYIYASEQPTASITIPSIVIWG